MRSQHVRRALPHRAPVGAVAAAAGVLTIASVLTAPTSAVAAGLGGSSGRAAPRTDPVPCLTAVPNIKPEYLAKIPSSTRQVIVARGVARWSYDNRFERWAKVGACWVNVSSVWSFNGAKGWHVRPWTGSLRSPIGAFSLTDAGGRLRNPGTTMHYHYGPQRYERGGYKISYPVQLYNYVVAINYNRRIGKRPRDTRQPDPNTGSGYWIHQRGLGVTRGCLSLTKKQLRATLIWLRKADHPYVVMGPQSVIGTGPALQPPPD